MRIGEQAQREMEKARAKLPVPKAYAFFKPVTQVEEQSAKQQAYGRTHPGNPVKRSKSMKGRIPHTLNQSIPGHREWEGDRIDPKTASLVLAGKGGWREYGKHSVRSAFHEPPTEVKLGLARILDGLFGKKPPEKVTLAKALRKKL